MKKNRIRLTESQLHRVIKESVNKVLREAYSEVRNDFYDELKGATAIDAWETMDDNEEGKVVAWVYDNGRVEWNDPNAQHDPNIKDAIDDVLNNLG